MADKRKRLALITKILTSETVSDQERLRDLLADAGLSVSQSTLSRDLKNLGVLRLRVPDGALKYAIPDEPLSAKSEDVFHKRFATSVTGIIRCKFIVLLFTPPGEAQLVGRLLDQAAIKGLCGTLAGDDTIICVAQNEKTARVLERRFKEIIA